jgi:hypothetical protein
MVWISARRLIEHPGQGMSRDLKVRKNTLLIPAKPWTIGQEVPLLGSLSILRAPSCLRMEFRLRIIGYE